MDFIHMTSAEVKAKTGPKRGESTEFLLGWTPVASLHWRRWSDDSGDGEFTGKAGSGCLVRTDSGTTSTGMERSQSAQICSLIALHRAFRRGRTTRSLLMSVHQDTTRQG